MNNIERNTTKIIIILIFYAVAMKTNVQREINAMTTTIITLYNNINQQRQLKKIKKKKTLIFKIKEQSEKNNLRTLFIKKLMKRLQWIKKIKKNVMTIRLFNENVKLITRSKKIKNRLIINNSLMKNVASSTYAMSRIFEILIHEMRVIDVQMNNQQNIIRRIKKQNEILHSNLRIARIIWSKNVINEKKNCHH